MRRSHPCLIEPLEPRQLFSAAAVAPIVATPQTSRPATAVKLAPAGTGVTLNLVAGVAFTGEVAFIPSPAAGLGPSTTIDWGDGAISSATLQTTMQNGITGYEVIGSHTYADPGTYSIATRMLLTPITQPGQPTPQFVVVEPSVISTAIVAPAVGSSGSSSPTTTVMTIHEVAGTKFTANLGSFIALAPGTRLRATIKWGDGKTSVGKLVPSGVVGIDEVTFDVTGTHKYAHPGTYGIAITVIQRPVGTSLATQNIASFDAIAIVTAKPAK